MNDDTFFERLHFYFGQKDVCLGLELLRDFSFLSFRDVTLMNDDNFLKALLLIWVCQSVF